MRKEERHLLCVRSRDPHADAFVTHGLLMVQSTVRQTRYQCLCACVCLNIRHSSAALFKQANAISDDERHLSHIPKSLRQKCPRPIPYIVYLDSEYRYIYSVSRQRIQIYTCIQCVHIQCIHVAQYIYIHCLYVCIYVEQYIYIQRRIHTSHTYIHTYIHSTASLLAANVMDNKFTVYISYASLDICQIHKISHVTYRI